MATKLIVSQNVNLFLEIESTNFIRWFLLCFIRFVVKSHIAACLLSGLSAVNIYNKFVFVLTNKNTNSIANWFRNTERYSQYQFRKKRDKLLYRNVCVWVFRGHESRANSQRRLFWFDLFPYWVDLNETEPGNCREVTDAFA